MANKHTNDEVYHKMGDDVKHPTVDKRFVNDATNHEPKSHVELNNSQDGEKCVCESDLKKGESKRESQNHDYQYEFGEEFELDKTKFNKDGERKIQQPKSYVEGCDMGWC
ncbi:DUF2553 family protein [Bacillus shivajii]|uniref:DUF2553 family protein n=1 Tax=Bacillus shivajii TaxID=1983719 RepID=UPI001CF9AF62|nr:DUF2553 family protein [Bacillus shivajii]UCZ52573.1 DUF2553 family protein [Bacillus shivajii]